MGHDSNQQPNLHLHISAVVDLSVFEPVKASFGHSDQSGKTPCMLLES